MIPLAGRCSCGFRVNIHFGPDEFVTNHYGCMTCHVVYPYAEKIGDDGTGAALKRLDSLSKTCETCGGRLADLEIVSLEKKKRNLIEKLLFGRRAKYIGICPGCSKRELRFR